MPPTLRCVVTDYTSDCTLTSLKQNPILSHNWITYPLKVKLSGMLCKYLPCLWKMSHPHKQSLFACEKLQRSAPHCVHEKSTLPWPGHIFPLVLDVLFLSTLHPQSQGLVLRNLLSFRQKNLQKSLQTKGNICKKLFSPSLRSMSIIRFQNLLDLNYRTVNGRSTTPGI